jgi:hypothetical protein
MAIKETDEDDLIEKDDEDDKDESDEDDSGKKSSNKKEDEEDDSEVEIEIEEDEEEKDKNKKDERIAVQGRKNPKDETQEEKRARRRKEKRERNDRNHATRRELANIQQVVARLAKENEELKNMAGEFGKREASRDEQQIDSAINGQRSLYSTAGKAIYQGYC